MRQYLEEKVLGVYKQQVASGAPAGGGAAAAPGGPEDAPAKDATEG
jgi:hypothetical protein